MHYLKCFLLLFIINANANNSVCYGETHNGSISDAVRLPQKGSNFKVFSDLAWYLGRTYTHSDVYQVIIQVFDDLSVEFPTHEFMYAETGWHDGGLFKPHKTHQNGLSVDFMVPVYNSKGQSSFLPVNIKNKWGYDIEFNENGQFDGYQIDFAIMAEHIKLLHERSKEHDFSIKRVIFDPRLQPALFNTKHGQYIKEHIRFNKLQAWVRHDEHYHVDFDIKCKKLPQ